MDKRLTGLGAKAKTEEGHCDGRVSDVLYLFYEGANTGKRREWWWRRWEWVNRLLSSQRWVASARVSCRAQGRCVQCVL